MKKLSERIEWLLENTGSKPADAARAAGIDKGYFSNLRHGIKANPSEDLILALSRFFDCDPEWLRSGEGESKLSENVVRETVETSVEGALKQDVSTDDLIRVIQDQARLLTEGKPHLRWASAEIIAGYAAELQKRLDPRKRMIRYSNDSR